MQISGWPLRIGILVLVGVGIFLGASIPQGPPPERTGKDLARVQGKVVLYEDPGLEPDSYTNVTLTEVSSGKSASLANDLRAQVRQGTVLRTGSQDGRQSVGYVALVEDGTLRGRAPYDVVLVRFADMARIVLDRGVASMEGTAIGKDGQLTYSVRDAEGREARRKVDLAAAQPAAGTRIVEAKLVPVERKSSGPAVQ